MNRQRYKRCDMHEVVRVVRRYALRSSTNNFKGSYFDNLIAVPRSIPVPTTAVVRSWGGRCGGCAPKLHRNSRKPCGSFSLEAPVVSERLAPPCEV